MPEPTLTDLGLPELRPLVLTPKPRRGEDVEAAKTRLAREAELFVPLILDALFDPGIVAFAWQWRGDDLVGHPRPTLLGYERLYRFADLPQWRQRLRRRCAWLRMAARLPRLVRAAWAHAKAEHERG